jgi:modulator of FtsH protease HflC
MNPAIRNRILAALLAAIIVLSSMLFSLPEGRMAVITLFERPVGVHETAGLKIKLPYPFQKAYIMDVRSRLYETRLTETLTRDKRNVVLVTYAVWHIQDPVRFLQAVGTPEAAQVELDGVVTNAKNAVMGRYEFAALVSSKPGEQRVGEIEQAMLAEAGEAAVERYGIGITQIGLQRLALPEENIPYVFDQMKAERGQYAARYRAEGEREAARIRAETDLTAARLRAEGKEQAERIRGQAEAEAARVYASAHRRDPAFYAFMRSLDSLESMMGANTTVVLGTDSPPFNVLRQDPAKGDAR